MYLDASYWPVLSEEHPQRLLGDVLRQTRDVNIGGERVSSIVRAGEDGGVLSSCG